MLHGGDVAPWAEAALYAASRAQHVEQLIRPALARGATVICDRYVDSSVAYQGIARGLGLERVLELNLAAVAASCPTGRSCSRSAPMTPWRAWAATATGSSARTTASMPASPPRIASWPHVSRRDTWSSTAPLPAEEIAEEIDGALRGGS